MADKSSMHISPLTFLGLIFLAGGVLQIGILYGYIDFEIPYNALGWLTAVGAIMGGLKLIFNFKLKVM